MDNCDESVDLILLPEYSNAPGSETKSELKELVRSKTSSLIDSAKTPAKSCKALVAVNLIKEIEGRFINTTCLFRKNGQIIAGERDVLATAIKLAPDIPRCCLEGQTNYTLVIMQ